MFRQVIIVLTNILKAVLYISDPTVFLWEKKDITEERRVHLSLSIVFCTTGMIYIDWFVVSL